MVLWVNGFVFFGRTFSTDFWKQQFIFPEEILEGKVSVEPKWGEMSRRDEEMNQTFSNNTDMLWILFYCFRKFLDSKNYAWWRHKDLHSNVYCLTIEVFVYGTFCWYSRVFGKDCTCVYYILAGYKSKKLACVWKKGIWLMDRKQFVKVQLFVAWNAD